MVQTINRSNAVSDPDDRAVSVAFSFISKFSISLFKIDMISSELNAPTLFTSGSVFVLIVEVSP